MPYMNWDTKFETGVAIMDEQHRGLVDMVNRLHDAMKAGKGREELGKVLGFLADYTVTHFQTEEGLMQKHAYPGYANHKGIHTDLLKQVGDLVDKHKRGEAVLTLKVMDFLQDWLLKHIGEEDKRLASFLKERRVK